MTPLPERVAILGLGLMGGSLGLALKASGYRGQVVGYTRRKEWRRKALLRGVVDEVHGTPAAAAAQAGLVVLCVPICSMPGLLLEARPGIGIRTVVTDVGSTKHWVMEKLPPLLRKTGAVFVGGHPLAGSEQQGLDSARAELYAGSVCVLTPSRMTPSVAAVRTVRRFWQSLGVRVVQMTAADHDAAVARTSHLPHLASAALARLAGTPGRPLTQVCGPGFRDITRLAEGAPELWLDIVCTNRDALLDSLDILSKDMAALRGYLRSGNEPGVLKWLHQARVARRRLVSRTTTGKHNSGGK